MPRHVDALLVNPQALFWDGGWGDAVDAVRAVVGQGLPQGALLASLGRGEHPVSGGWLAR